MKKILLFSLSVFLTGSVFSQTIWTDNFESYNVGNLGTQGGWERTGESNPNWTKVASIDAAHGKSFKVASTAANADGVYQSHEIDWNSRMSGNDILVLDFDFYTGVIQDGYSIVQVYDVEADFEILFQVAWDGEYLFLEDADGGVDLDDNATPNTWYHIKITYDPVSGEIKTQLNNTGEIFEYTGLPGLEPTEFDVLLIGETTVAVDNIIVAATDANSLAVSDLNTVKSKVSVYPNPATDMITVKSDCKIAQVSIIDISGKVVKTSSESSVNVENLAKGAYLVSVEYADGSTETKKVIKK